MNVFDLYLFACADASGKQRLQRCLLCMHAQVTSGNSMETDLFKYACEQAVSKLGNCLEMYSCAQATAQYVHSMQVAMSGKSCSTHRRSSLLARLHSAGRLVRKEPQNEVA